MRTQRRKSKHLKISIYLDKNNKKVTTTKNGLHIFRTTEVITYSKKKNKGVNSVLKKEVILTTV